MATSGYIEQTGGNHTVRLEWNTIQVIQETNSTKLNWSLKLSSTTGIGLAANRPYTVKFNGQIFGGYADCGIGKDQIKELASGTAIIPHNADGTKSFAYSFEIEVTWAPKNIITASGTGELDPIVTEVTKAAITSAPNFTDEDNPVITYSNPMGEKVTSLQACIASEDGSSIFVGYRDISKTGTEYTFNFTESERSQLLALLNSSTTYSVRFYIKSVINGVTYHSYSPVKTLSIINAYPVLTASATSTNTTSNSLVGSASTILKGFNTVLCTLTATPKKNATIVERTVTCGGETKSGSNITFTNVESGSFTFRIKDSRGIVVTKIIYLTMKDYIKPTCNQTVTMIMQSSTTTQAEFTATGKYFNGSFGAVNNTILLESRRRDNGGDWSDWADVSILINDISNNTYTASGNISGLDASGTYDFQFRVTDKLMTVESTIGSFTLLPVFDWSKTDFNFNVPVTIQGGLVHDYVIETGTASMGSNGTWYWSKWKSGRAECYGCRNYGNMAVSTQWGSLYKSTTYGQDLPSGLFATKPEAMQIQIREAGSGCWISSQIGWAPDETTTGGFSVTSPASGNISQVYISFNIVGRWK